MRRRVAKSAVEANGRAASNAKLGDLAAVAKEFSSFGHAPSVLTRVRAVPTIFPQFDLATKVGGIPIERVSLLHGPSTGGKTYVAIGMMLSFLMLGNPVYFIDAERTTPITWLEQAMGDYAHSPLFFANKPKTYEQTRENVRHFLNKVRTLRDKGRLHPDASALVVVDSIRKLVPKDTFDKIMREQRKPGEKQEGARDRAAQLKAQMNAAWMDEVIPLLDETKTGMLIIAREILDPNNTNAKAIKWGTNVKTAGGGALFYDASLDLRSTKRKAYGKKVKGADGEDRLTAYGDVHQLDITKSKVSGKEEFRASCTFHISNGAWTPAGFDRGRDLLELARRFDIVEGTGWLKYRSTKWRSEDLAVKRLAEDAVLFAEIDAKCRSMFKREVPP